MTLKRKLMAFPTLAPLFARAGWENFASERQNMLQSFLLCLEKCTVVISLSPEFFFLGFISPPPELPNTHKFSFQLLIHMLDWNELLLSIVVCELFGLTVNTSEAAAGSRRLRWNKKLFAYLCEAAKLNLFASSMALLRIPREGRI